MTGQRADLALVARGLFPSRAKAREAIEAGLVTAGGRPVGKPSETIPDGVPVTAEPPYPWVSRGGVKLEAALDAFGFDPAGATCLDVGASTGGFTDVLLARGARRVYAVDVGHGQLHPRLRADARVVALEGTDARRLAAEPALVPEPPALIVVDVSFISLKLVLPELAGLGHPGNRLVALVKPQFEAGRAHVRKGLVRDEAVRAAVCRDIADLLRDLGYRVAGPVPSPITGGDGNVEFLIGGLRGDG